MLARSANVFAPHENEFPHPKKENSHTHKHTYVISCAWDDFSLKLAATLNFSHEISHVL